jgi:hypothetical protein
LGSRFSINAKPLGSFEPLFCAQQRVKIKGEAGINSLRFDIDGPEQVRLPAHVKAMIRDDWKLKVVAKGIFFECPKPVLAVYDLDRMSL